MILSVPQPFHYYLEPSLKTGVSSHVMAYSFVKAELVEAALLVERPAGYQVLNFAEPPVLPTNAHQARGCDRVRMCQGHRTYSHT